MIAAIIVRLKEAGTPFKSVAGVAEMALLDGQAPDRAGLPGAYVAPIAHRADRNQTGTLLVHQRVTARIGVAILAGAEGERRGEKATLAIEDLYWAARRRLVGWRPADTANESYQGPFVSAGGAITGIEKGIVSWLEQFEIPLILRSV